MSYKDLPSYKLLLDLGCREETGPVQSKRGIVKLTIYDEPGSLPGRAFVHKPYYHFDPNYDMDGKIYAKAKIVSTFNSYFNIYTKEKDANPLVDYDLAFLSFILNFYDKKKIKIPTYENIYKLIFKRVFNG